MAAFFGSYEILTQIGSGCFGQIFKVSDRRTGKNFSLKKVLVDSGYFNRELTILQKVKNTESVLNLIEHLLVPIPECLAYLASESSPKTALAANELKALANVEKKYESVLFLITKCYPVNLRTAVLHQKLTQRQAKLIVRKLCIGVRNLHRLGICHRDLKSENILVDLENEDVCVADLGSAKEFTPEVKGGVAYICSRPYRAPELLLGHTDYDFSIDLWSIGCIIYETLTSGTKRLFTGESGKIVLLEIIGLLGLPTKDDLDGLGEKRAITLVSEIKEREIDNELSKDSDLALVQLMKECLRWNPKQRANLDFWLQGTQLSD